jgi:hypothetical protein
VAYIGSGKVMMLIWMSTRVCVKNVTPRRPGLKRDARGQEVVVLDFVLLPLSIS